MISNSQNARRAKPILILLAQAAVLIGLVIWAYGPGLNSQFQLDDGRIIAGNVYIRMLDWSPHTLWRAAFQDGGNNRPLTNITLALNYYFGGYKPRGYHLVNLGILFFTAMGIWLVLIKLFARLGYERSRAELAAWLAALLWSVHPVNIQAITYVAQRYASMAGAFSIWSIYFFHLGQEAGKRNWRFFIISGLFCFFAIMSKETALTLPALLLCYKLYFFDGFARGWLGRNWKWILALAVFYALAGAILLRPGMAARIETDVGKMPYSVWLRSLSEPRVFVWYISLLLFPFPQSLSLIHDFAASTSIFSPWTTAICLVLVLGATFLAIYRARSWKIYSFAMLWYWGQLMVEALPLPIDLAHEHRLYLASLAIIVPAVAWPILKLKKPGLALGWILLIAVFFAQFSWQRNHTWQTEEKLLKDTATKAPGSSMVWSLYCRVLGKINKYDSAIPACQMAVRLSPSNYLAHFTLGVLYLKAEQPELAETELQKAIEIWPNEYGAHNYLGFLYMKAGKLEPAEQELLKAVELSRESVVQPLFNLAVLYSLKGDHPNAAKWYLAALARDPSNAQAHYFLAQTYLALKQGDDYLRELRKAVDLNPEGKNARLELARALAGSNRCPEATALIQAIPADDPQAREILSYCQSQ